MELESGKMCSMAGLKTVPYLHPQYNVGTHGWRNPITGRERQGERERERLGSS